MPQWEGGNNRAYKFGAELLAWLAPKTNSPVINIETTPLGEDLPVKDGIVGKEILLKHLDQAAEAINKHQPDNVVMLGGDCLVDLAPFAYLSKKYQKKFGILWIDAHPDVMQAAQYENAHAHVLGMLMGNGDSDFVKRVDTPVETSRVLIAGINEPNDYEKSFLAEKGIQTITPEGIRSGKNDIEDWIKREGITHLAVHWDLDSLDPHNFRSLLFAKPQDDPKKWEGVGKGKLQLDEVVDIMRRASAVTSVVGVGIAEHIPWDSMYLKEVLEKLPLLNE